MQIDCGKYQGRDVADLPTEYLEWASVHLRLSSDVWDAVMAEKSRRVGVNRVASETAAHRLIQRPVRAFNRVAARLRLGLIGD